MLKAVTRGEVDLVAAWAVDRLGRSLQHLVETLSELQATYYIERKRDAGSFESFHTRRTTPRRALLTKHQKSEKCAAKPAIAGVVRGVVNRARRKFSQKKCARPNS